MNRQLRTDCAVEPQVTGGRVGCAEASEAVCRYGDKILPVQRVGSIRVLNVVRAARDTAGVDAVLIIAQARDREIRTQIVVYLDANGHGAHSGAAVAVIDGISERIHVREARGRSVEHPTAAHDDNAPVRARRTDRDGERVSIGVGIIRQQVAGANFNSVGREAFDGISPRDRRRIDHLALGERIRRADEVQAASILGLHCMRAVRQRAGCECRNAARQGTRSSDSAIDKEVYRAIR